MRVSSLSKVVASVGLMAALTTAAGGAGAAQPTSEERVSTEWKAVEEALGRKGTMQPGGVFRVSFPRQDLLVRIGSVTLEPSFALGSYAVFRQAGPAKSGDTMMMGDLVLRDEEVSGVMTRLFERGIEVPALHNHLNEMTPHVMYMHVSAHGEAGRLAAALREALGPVYTPDTGTPRGASPAHGGTIDVKQIESALGHTGRLNGAGIFQVSVPRAGTITQDGVDVPPALGVATALNFQPTGSGRAAITGDFVLIASEVSRVARTLRQHGIAVTALHNHGLAEEPRLFYMHFWAVGDVVKLARGLRAALDQTDSRAP